MVTETLLRTLCILSATGAVLTLAVCALAPLAQRFLPARWLKNAATLVLLAFVLPVWLALPPLSLLLPARSAPQAQDTPPAAAETMQTAQTDPVQPAADPGQAQQLSLSCTTKRRRSRSRSRPGSCLQCGARARRSCCAARWFRTLCSGGG